MIKTKKSLWAAGLALLISIALLIATTFAWFTDSVTNSGNRIQAGNLEVDLLMDKSSNGTYTSIANGTGDIFSTSDNGANWEPGMTKIVYLAVQNKGNLALNYNIILDVTDGNPGLVGSLDYAILDGKKASDISSAKSWNDIKAIEGVQTGQVAEGKVTAAPNGTLDEIVNGTANETDYFALAVHMNENAGNEYQGGIVTIDINVIAKQATAEKDGFDSDQYDKDSEYAYSVTTSAELMSAMKAANVGEKVLITEGTYTINENINTDAKLVIDEGDTVTLDLDGKTIASKHSDSHNHATLQNFGNLTVKDGTIINNDTTGTEFGNPAITQSSGEMKLENCTITNKAGTSGSYCVGIVGGTAEIKNCTINGDRGGLSVENNAYVTVTGCNISAAYYYPIYVYGNGESTFENTIFTKLPKLETQSGSGGNYLIYNDFCPQKYGDKGSASFENCKFISTRDGGSMFEIRTDKLDPAFTSLKFNNCSYKNVTNVPTTGFTEIQ